MMKECERENSLWFIKPVSIIILTVSAHYTYTNTRIIYKLVSFPESHHRRRHTNDFGTIVLTALQQQFQCIIHFWVRVIYEPCRQRRDNGFANDTRDWSHKTIRETIAADILRRWNVRASRLIYAPIYNIYLLKRPSTISRDFSMGI